VRDFYCLKNTCELKLSKNDIGSKAVGQLKCVFSSVDKWLETF
jgi:hypothetical protein